MVDTLLSERVEETLFRLSWVGLSGAVDQWAVLFRLLPALHGQRDVLGATSGTIRVALGLSDEPTFEEWPVIVGADTRELHARVEACSEGARPLESPLTCEPLLWLPDDQIKLVDYDDTSDGPELWSPGYATISEVVSTSLSAPSGLSLWRLHHAPVPLLSLEVTCWSETEVGLWIKSNCDLWRPQRLDGEPNGPHGDANGRLLANSLAQVAAATGARLKIEPSLRL